MRFDPVCSTQELNHDQSSQHHVAGMAVGSVVLGLRTERSEGSKKSHRRRTAHRSESLVGRKFGSLNLCHLEVLVRYTWPAQKNGEFLQKETHPVEAACNVTAPAVQAKGLSMKKTGRVDFDKTTAHLQTTAPQTVEEQTEVLLCGSQL